MKAVKLMLSFLMLLMFFNINAQKGQKGNFFQIVEKREAEFKQKFAQKSSLSKEEVDKLDKDYKKYLRWLAFWEKRVDANGNMGAYAKNLLNTSNISAYKSSAQQRNVNASWSQIGPAAYPSGTNPSGILGIGRIDAIVVNPSNSSHVIIGARSGGIWETLDINATNVVWNCLTNDIPSATVNDLEIVNNTLYASVSSVGTVSGEDDYYGLGVIRKDLNSSEWIIPKEKFDSYRMAISTSNPKVIYSVSNKKVHRSADGGVTWEALTDPVSNINDTRLYLEFVEVNPLNSDVAIVTGRLHKWASVPDTTANLLVFRTQDGGKTWINLTDTLETVINDTFASAGSWDTPMNFSTVHNLPDAFSTYNYNGKLYLCLRANTYRAYFLTADGVWDNFSMYNSLGTDNRFGYYVDAVTPVFQVVNPNDILYGGWFLRSIKNPYHSISTIASFSQLHQDVRSVNYDVSLGRLLVGTDGSIHKAFDTGNNLVFPSYPNMAGNLNLFLAYNMGYVNAGGTRRVRIGTQDTGFYENTFSGFGWGGWSRTNSVWGEGMVFTDPSNANNVYFDDRRNLKKSTNAGASITSTLFVVGEWSVGGGEAFQVNPNNSNQLVFDKSTTGGNYPIHLSNNQLSSQVDISNGISDLVIGRNLALEISKANSSTLYVARRKFGWTNGINSTIYKTTNLNYASPGSITYTNITGNLSAYDPDILTQAFIEDIEVDDTNANKVWIGFGNLEEGKKVYYSSNGGTTWTNISSNLPNIPLNTVQYDAVNQTLYVGTDYGVYYYNDSTGLWARYGVGLPVSIVTTIAIDNTANEIVASTHGRSVWAAPLMTAPCNNRIVNSTEVWTTDVDICGDLIIQNGGWVRSHARIKANNIIIEAGGKLTSETGEITSNHHNTTSGNLNTDIFVESSAEINLAAATVNSFNINVESGANIFIIPPRGGLGTTALNHSRINVYDGGTYNHSVSHSLVLNDLESTVNLFDDFNFGAFGYATKVDAVPFSGDGSLNIIDLSDIYIQNESLISNSKYRWDSDTSITAGNDVDPNPFLPSGDFDTNNADVILKAKQSITLDPGTIIETDSFIAFIDGEDLTNFNRNVIEEEVKEEYPIDKYDKIQEITTKIVESVSVYPNPATSFLEIKLNDETMQGSEVILRDVAGNILKKISLEKDGARIDLSSFKKGVYLLHFSKGSKKLFKRVIKL